LPINQIKSNLRYSNPFRKATSSVLYYNTLLPLYLSNKKTIAKLLPSRSTIYTFYPT